MIQPIMQEHVSSPARTYQQLGVHAPYIYSSPCQYWVLQKVDKKDGARTSSPVTEGAEAGDSQVERFLSDQIKLAKAQLGDDAGKHGLAAQ